VLLPKCNRKRQQDDDCELYKTTQPHRTMLQQAQTLPPLRKTMQASRFLFEYCDSVLIKGDCGFDVASQYVAHRGRKLDRDRVYIVVSEDEDALTATAADGDVDPFRDIGENGSEASVGEHPGNGAFHCDRIKRGTNISDGTFADPARNGCGLIVEPAVRLL